MTAAAFCVAAFFAPLAWQAWSTPYLFKHVDGVVTRAQGIEHRVYGTIDNIDKASKTWADSSKTQAGEVTDLITQFHGVLSTTDTAIWRLGHAADTANAQLLHVGPLLDSAKLAVDSIPPAVKQTGDAATQVGNAAGQLGTLAGSINKTVTDPQTAELLGYLRSTSKSVAHMADTTDQVETKFAHPYLHPSTNPFKRAWEQASPYIEAGAKITASLF